MCKFKLFSIAAAALMMVACSTEDLTQQTQIKTGEMHFTATIAAPSGTTRTTYEQDGDNINVKWVVGDEIALVHNKVKDVAKVKSISSDGTSATIEGILTGNPQGGDAVQMFYPATLITGVTSDGNPVLDNNDKMFNQDGTLDYIQKNLDYHLAIGQLSVDGSEATLSSAATMHAMIAIWKLKLKDNASALLEASKVTIKMGSGDYTTSATATLSSPKSELTIATSVPPAIDNVRPITIEATVDNDTYVYTQDNVDVNPGTYYQSTVTMTKATAASKALTAVTSSELGWRVCSDGKAYEATGSLPTGVSAVAVICYVGNNGEAAPYNHGLALALTDESSSGMQWEAAKTACNTNKNTSTPITGAKWLLASKDQWGYMSSAVLSNIGLQVTKYYWSSTYTSEPFLRAWAYQFSNNSWNQFNGTNSGAYNRVRACLAF